jgi:DNA repair exonuclease SbcCD ATPase subunit
MKSLEQYRLEVDASLSEYRHACRTVKEELAHRKQDRRDYQVALRAREVLQKLAKAVQEKAHQQISEVVTHAIRAGGWDYDFKLIFEEKRGKTEARPVFVRDGHEVSPTGAAGGGVVDVAALALRLAAVLLSTPKKRKLLVLDEPFKAVNGKSHRRKVARLLAQLPKQLNFQFVVASGLEWLVEEGGKVIHVGGQHEVP